MSNTSLFAVLIRLGSGLGQGQGQGHVGGQGYVRARVGVRVIVRSVRVKAKVRIRVMLTEELKVRSHLCTSELSHPPSAPPSQLLYSASFVLAVAIKAHN